MRTLVVEARRAPCRCAVCHDALDLARVECALCGAALHPDCGKNLGRCPSLGCAGRLVPEPLSPREAPRTERYPAWSEPLFPYPIAFALVLGVTVAALTVASTRLGTDGFSLTVVLVAIQVLVVPLVAFSGARRVSEAEGLARLSLTVVAALVGGLDLVILEKLVGGLPPTAAVSALRFGLFALEPPLLGIVAERATRRR